MDHGYFDRAWNALTHDPDWWKTMVILFVVQIVPVFGQVVALGYFYRWARDAAWGIEGGLPKCRSGLRAVVKAGAIVLVTALCWGLVFDAMLSLLGTIPFIGLLFDLLFLPLMLIASMFFLVMGLRGVIYDSFEPALQVRQAWEMVRREPQGFLRIFAISLLPVLLTLPLGLLLFALFAAGYAGADSGQTAALLSTWTSVSSGYIPFLVILCLLITALIFFGCLLIEAVIARSLGYWMAQFEPARWGSSSEGVPSGTGPRRVSDDASDGPVR